MKRILLCIILIGTLSTTQAQTASPDHQSVDSTTAIRVIDNYLSLIDFNDILKDSMLCAVSHIIDRSHPKDTMTVYHWYMKGRRLRIEMWQEGQLSEGYYSDGKSLFRIFRSGVREWADVQQDQFYDYTMPHDIRGALYDWRSKGAEPRYAGTATFEGHDVHRVFVTSPGIFDRYYYFEKNSGLLFMLTEEDRVYGDAKRFKNAQRVDWRAWHEFTPLNGVLFPSIESYQYNNSQVVLIFRQYHFEPIQETLFTEDFHLM